MKAFNFLGTDPLLVGYPACRDSIGARWLRILVLA